MSFTRLGIGIKFHRLVLSGVLFSFWASFIHAQDAPKPAEGCSPTEILKDFNALAVPAAFRPQFQHWLRQVDPTGKLSGVEFLRDSVGLPLMAGDALLVRHHGHLKLVSPSVTGSDLMPKERSLEGDDVQFASKINDVYVVKTVSYDNPADKNSAVMEHLMLFDDADMNPKEKQWSEEKITHQSAPARSGELFVFGNKIVFVSRLKKALAKDDPFAAMVHERGFSGKVTSATFEELEGMPVLKVVYGTPRDRGHGTVFNLYRKGFILLMDSKGTHQTFSLETPKGPRRYFLLNRTRDRSGISHTEVIEAFPDIKDRNPRRDIYLGSFVLDLARGPTVTQQRFVGYAATWHQFDESGDTLVSSKPALFLLSDPENGSVKKTLTPKLFPLMVNRNDRETELNSALLLEPELVFESDQVVAYRTSLSSAAPPFISSEGLVILHKQDRRVHFMAYDAKGKAEGRPKTPTSSWQDDLAIHSSHRVFSVTQEEDFGPNLLVVRFITSQGKPAPFVLLVDPVTKARMVIPGFRRVIKKTFRGKEYLFIFGRIGTTNQVPFTVYEYDTRGFRNTQKFDTRVRHDGQPYFTETVSFQDADHVMMPVPILARDIDSVKVGNFLSTSWAYFDVEGGGHAKGKTIRYLLDLSDSDRMIALEGPRRIAQTGQSPYRILVGTALRERTGQVNSEGKKFPSQTTLVLLPLKEKGSDHTLDNVEDKQIPIILQGEVDTLKVDERRYIEAHGHISRMGRQDVTEYHLDIRSEGEDSRELVNKVGTPVYTDPEDGFELYATQGSGDLPPKLFMYKYPTEEAPVGKWDDIELSVSRLASVTLQVVFFTHAGAEITKEEMEKMMLVPNTQQIQRVKRDGNFLLVTTAEGDGKASYTYVYNLAGQEVVFYLPNYVTHFDLGEFRFWVGNAGPFNNTHVVVTKLETGDQVASFDFGQSVVDIQAESCIRYDEANQTVVFKMTSGHERVYDVRKQHFYGLLPNKVLEILTGIENLGLVVNQRIFEGRGNQDPLLEQEELIRRVERQFQVMTPQSGSQFTIVVGANGTGRSAVLNEYGSRYISGALKPMPQQKLVFFSLDPTSVTAETKYRGTFSDKFQSLKKVSADLSKEGYRLVLMIDDFDSFRREAPDKDDEGDVFTQLKTLMQAGSFDILASATPGGYERLVHEAGGLMSSFGVVNVEPLSEQKAYDAIREYLRRQPRQIHIADPLLRLMIERVRQLQVHKLLPGSAFELIKRIIRVKSQEVELGQPMTITREDVNRHLAEQTKVPAMLFDPEEIQRKMPELLAYMLARVRNQHVPVERTVAAIRAFALGINRADWPIIRALFLGPTGVGKTELVRAIAEFVFGDKSRVLVINGPEYSGSHIDVVRLSKKITDHIKQYPCNIILLDEFEKMHPEAQNIILTLADGGMPDEHGRNISSALTMLFATSNLGAVEAIQAASHQLGFNRDVTSVFADMHQAYQRALDELRPEVLNRFDIVEIFNSLDEATARVIAQDYFQSDKRLSTTSIKQRMAAQNIHIDFDDSVIERAIKQYMDYRFGARRLASRIETHVVEEFLSREMLEGRLVPGRTYLIRYNDELQRYESIEIEDLDAKAVGQ